MSLTKKRENNIIEDVVIDFNKNKPRVNHRDITGDDVERCKEILGKALFKFISAGEPVRLYKIGRIEQIPERLEAKNDREEKETIIKKINEALSIRDYKEVFETNTFIIEDFMIGQTITTFQVYNVIGEILYAYTLGKTNGIRKINIFHLDLVIMNELLNFVLNDNRTQYSVNYRKHIKSERCSRI